MRIAYLDCFAGISGDMFLGALLAAGVPVEVLEEAVASLGLGARLRVETVDRSGISATKVHVLEGDILAEQRPGHAHQHAHAETHAETHADSHDHSHAGEPAHTHEPVPAKEHPHEHGDAGHKQEPHTHHPAAHPHPHAAEPERGGDPHREHVHEHGHEHEHEHEHRHAHAHPHTDEHEHEHDHPHVPGHTHDHAHGHTHAHAHPHTHGRSLSVIRTLIGNAPLPAPVRQFAIRTFELLGSAEAKIHNVPVEHIHFHEVGAVDAIVDIVAASAGVHYLQQKLGPVQWYCSAINVGGGMVECAHGTFPVPAPATADLLRGMPTFSAHVQKELVTPTGAAILAALAPQFAAQPAARIDSIGYGAGTRNPAGFPNVLRLSVGTLVARPIDTPVHLPDAQAEQGQDVLILETAIDDATPQLLAYVGERALEHNALDVMLTPVIMKKGRPGTLITVLANPGDGEALEQLLLRETTTLGVRRRTERRSCLLRRHTAVETPYGTIRIKVGSLAEETVNAVPEYEDCRAAALRHGVPLKQVMQSALAGYAGQRLAEEQTETTR